MNQLPSIVQSKAKELDLKLFNSRTSLTVVHKSPDFDAVGSALALHLQLISLGKQNFIWIADSLDESFNFLPLFTSISNFLPSTPIDTLITLDLSEVERIKDYELLKTIPYSTCINIDHHTDNKNFGNLNIVDPNISSVGELLYWLFKFLNWSITPDIATCLYASIIFDTGRFQYSNTSDLTFLAAADLVKHGADNVQITEHIFENKKPGYFSTIQKAMDNLIINQELKFAYTLIPNGDRDSGHAAIDFIRSLQNIDIFLVFNQLSEETVKVNLRSKNNFNVAAFAKNFGGGGHKKAAGITNTGTISDISKTIINSLKTEIKNFFDS